MSGPLVALLIILLSAALVIPSLEGSVQASSGSFLRIWGGPSSSMASKIALDTSGNISITGDTASFGGGGFLLKYDRDGNIIAREVWEAL